MPGPDDPQSTGSLWEFAVAVYAQPGVEAACLDLQNRLGLDVNLLLFAVWSAYSGPGQFNVSAFRDCIALVRPWREQVIEPLRGLRRHCRQGVVGVDATAGERVAGKLQALELEAEKVELGSLSAWSVDRGKAVDAGDAAAAAASNLVAYLSAAGVGTSEAAAAMRTILAAAASAEVRPA